MPRPLLAVLADMLEAAGVAGVLLQLHRPCHARDGEEQAAARVIRREQHLLSETREWIDTKRRTYV